MSSDKKQQLEQKLWSITDTLSEKMHTYANAILKPDKLKYEDLETHKQKKAYPAAIKEEALVKLR